MVQPEPEVTAFSTFEHKETFIRFERDRFEGFEGVVTFNFEVTETNVGVKINPVSQAVSFISHASELKAEVKKEPVVIPTQLTTASTEAVNVEIQTVHSEFNMQKNQLEVLLFTPPSGVVDGYVESVLINDPVQTRNNGFVDIDGPPTYTVTKRDATVIEVQNLSVGADTGYVGSYERTNVGHTISHFDGIFDDGSARVSGLSLLEVDFYYASLTIRDFEERADSSYTLSGKYFRLVPPTIQNPVQIATSNSAIQDGSFNGIDDFISVSSTEYFPEDGTLMIHTPYQNSFLGGGGIQLITYTSKTATSFNGCRVVKEIDLVPGSNTILGGYILSGSTEIHPYTV